VPNREGKEAVSETIYTVKKDLNTVDITRINRVIEGMKKNRIEIIILGCTELPLLTDRYPGGVEYIDTTSVLAKKAVEQANAQQ
jgi:aspartate/glutamate racemase